MGGVFAIYTHVRSSKALRAILEEYEKLERRCLNSTHSYSTDLSLRDGHLVLVERRREDVPT